MKNVPYKFRNFNKNIKKLKKSLENIKNHIDNYVVRYYYGLVSLEIQTIEKTMQEGGEVVSYAKLRGKIKEVYGKQSEFALAMGMDASSLSAKLNGKSPWKMEEIEKACELLEIPIEEVHQYFFCRKSLEIQTV